ncbi:hypothetical protein FRB99_004900 [Tulasnella sp. 403]|nr:hypothetical protein FRB99_004900 [Tulasnella sp. 403]
MVKLTFSKNSVWNTVIASPDHEILYEVTTQNKYVSRVTTITRLDRRSGEKVFAGEIAWKALEPLVRVGWQNCEWLPIRNWLANNKGNLTSAKSFTDGHGTKFRWKTRDWCLHLTPDDGVSKRTLAIFHEPKRDKLLRIREPAYLEVSPEISKTLDSVIVSLIIMEKRRRDG